MNTALQLVGIASTVAGAIVGTIGLCDMIPPTLGVVGWVWSIISLMRTLATRRRVDAQGDTPSIVWRVMFASVAIFCLLFLTAMATAGAANPQVIGPVERNSAFIMIALGMTSAGVAIWLAWK